MESPKTLTIDGKEYDVSSFGPQVQHLVGVHTRWKSEMVEERLALAKTEAAIKAVAAELSTAVMQELAERAAQEKT